MKTKEKRFLGIFKKKTTPAPAAPPLQQESVESNRTTAVESATTEDTTSLAFSSTPPEDVMPPRKGSIAQTSVIHYSPPGTVRASLPPSATSSVVSGGSDESGTVVITRKSNIVLDDEESVISTPVSQYDESPIVQKPRSKRAAPPPPPPTASIPPMTSSVAPSPSPATKREHFRQTSTNSIYSTATSSPPPPPPHRKQQENEVDYEEMLKKLQNKFEEWNQVRLEDGGSFKEEKIKAEMLKDHEKLKKLLEKQITSDRPKPVSNNYNIKNSNNNTSNGVKKQAPLKIPQYGNFYAPPVTSPSPPARVGVVPGGTVYQKVPKPSQNGTSPKTDENRNEVVVAAKQKISVGAVQNTEAVDRLRREVEEQRQREKEVKQYRNPKTLEVQVKSPEPKRKEFLPPPPPQSPTKSKPRMVEYKPMKSPGLPIDPEDIYEEIEEKAPPIPNTPPPKLSEYRKEQHTCSSPRMPTVPSNGYVRLQMNGASKKVAAPSAPVVSPTIQKIAQTPYTAPEFASSPKLLRKNPDPPQSNSLAKMYTSVPVKEEKKYERPQFHPQMTNGNSSPGGMITATSSTSSSSSIPTRKNPPMTRGASVDQNGFGYSTRITIPQAEQKVVSSPVNYRKMTKEVDANRTNRTVSEDQSNYGYASKTTINIATVPLTQKKSPSPSKLSPMTRAMSTDQTTIKSGALSPSSYRKISAPVTTSSPQPPTLRSLSTENAVPSPSANRRSMPTAGILSATSPKPTTISATSPHYPKTIPTVIPDKVPIAPKLPKQTSAQGETFDISDVLKGPKLRKVGMPVERSGISLGKVVDTEPSSNHPTSTPPPPPPPPQPVLASPALQPIASKNPDLRDSLMSEIREAGRLRAARAAQSA
ncbi:Protein CBG13305 [Caenorhabditis briggsae]|uniref:Protein CBG13305 n=1 Tax=Caenorhabditis briggsae TaxID=6238 RepID=A8XHJ0_CAEBR|nr:Protein CBG13305 [Caenorhabditis briggsae]CAP32114.1 Protein CBG13305 [Caenorhabditis briggsae]